MTIEYSAVTKPFFMAHRTSDVRDEDRRVDRPYRRRVLQDSDSEEEV